MSTRNNANTLLLALQCGEVELKGQFMLGSNYTFLADIHYEGMEYPVVYKPQRGEQPLWDFPDNTLALREVAAYILSEALGWGFVPLTLLRNEGPLGPGALQEYIDYDPGYHYFTFTEVDKARLRPVALFDLLANNADRKGSHVFVRKQNRKLYAIDHGLCFHQDDKLRTVIWDFAGEPIPADLITALERLRADLSAPVQFAGPSRSLRAALASYLIPDEVDALDSRAERLIRSGVFPYPPNRRRAYPYPPL
jgi:hypothetical protein